MFSTEDTIVAVATPPGAGGIGVVRISGPAASQIALDLLESDQPLQPRHASFRRVVDRTRPDRPCIVDEVVVTWFPAPASYTREDVVEISGHGNPVVLGRIVALATRAGARLAEPGEFTLRAFLNGRLDLIQAEAVADLIAAVTPDQARVAMDQLEGTLTGRLAAVGARLFDLVARLEASIDFPEEGFHFVGRSEVAIELEAAAQALQALIAEGGRGRLIREGATVVLTGRPNAGKSSLFNALVGCDRAIVTAIPGTTRDALAERVDLEGLAVTLIDTAGLGDAVDEIEAEGVRRAQAAAASCALALVVIDGSAPLTDREKALVAPAGPNAKLVIRSKVDLPLAWEPASEWLSDEVIDVSVRGQVGLEDLRRRIREKLTSSEQWRDSPALSNVRHLDLLERALGSLLSGLELVRAGDSEEVILVEVSAARRCLEAVTGRTSDEDVLRHIFSRFCIGK